GVKLEQASSTIADLQALNQHVIDSLPSGLATTDTAQRILTFNRAAEAITGLSFESVAGRPIAEVLQFPGQLLADLESDPRGAAARRADYRFKTERGEIEIGLGATHLLTPGGRAGLLFTFQDVTAVKKLERDVRIQQRLAAVGEMEGGIAHEIRNPRASIAGPSQTVRQELPLSAQPEREMDIVA